MKPTTCTYVVALLSLGLLACASPLVDIPPDGREDGGKRDLAPAAVGDASLLPDPPDATVIEPVSGSDMSLLADLSPSPLNPDLRTPTIAPTGATTALTQYGNLMGGMPYDDACPSGQVLMGFTGSLAQVSGYNGQISAQCGILQTAMSNGTTVVHVALGATLPTRGAQAAQSWTRSCPVDQVVVGMGGRSGLLVDQLIFRCAPIAISGAGYKVGVTDDLNPIGQNGGSAFPQTDCPTNQVASVARIRAGDAIDAFGLACTALAVQ